MRKQLLLLLMTILVLAVARYGEAGDRPKRLDGNGQPLPVGALARLGSSRLAFTGAPVFTPDAARYAQIDWADWVVVRETARGDELRHFPSGLAGVDRLAYGLGGKVLAAAGRNGVRLFDADTGAVQARSDYPKGCSAAETLAFSGDCRCVCVLMDVGAGRREVDIWQVDGVRPHIGIKALHDGRLEAVFSPDGKLLATWGDCQASGRPSADPDFKDAPRLVQLWDAASGEEVRRIKLDGGPVRTAAFSADGKTLATAGPASVQLWDAGGEKLRSTVRRPEHKSTLLAFSADCRTLAESDPDGNIWLTDTVTGKPLVGKSSDPPHAYGFHLSGDGRLLGLTWEGETQSLWEPAAGKILGSPDLTPDWIERVHFSPDGGEAVGVGQSGLVVVWDTAAWQVLRSFETMKSVARGKGVLVFADQRFVVVAALEMRHSEETTLEVWKTATGTRLGSFGPVPARTSGAEVYPDGKTLGYTGQHRRGDKLGFAPFHCFWDMNSGKSISWPTQEDFQGEQEIRVSSDGKVIVVANRKIPAGDDIDQRESVSVSVRSVDGKNLSSWPLLPDAGKGARVLALSPDGRLLLADDREACVLCDTATGRAIWRKEIIYDTYKWSVPVFSADGRALAVCLPSPSPKAENNSVAVLETATGRKRMEFSDGQTHFTSAAFSPDGRVLAATGMYSPTVLWDATGRLKLDPPAEPTLSAETLNHLWADLADEDAERAWQAVIRLAAAPADAVPYLKKQVRPAEGKAVDEAAIAKLVADLNADDFDEREKAEHALAAIGAGACPALHKAIASDPTPELKRRAEELLFKLRADELLYQLPKPDLSPNSLRLRRAVEALERTATPDAREWLVALTKGGKDADLTKEARAAVKRLEKRPAAAP